MNINQKIFYSFWVITISFVAYALVIIWLTWPVSEYSMTKAGLFGDSFGLLTSFFSALAFLGMIATILLQKEELELQRIEIAKSAVAQEQSAQLSALTALLNENEIQIDKNENFRHKPFHNTTPQERQNAAQIPVKLAKLQKEKEYLISKIQEILQKSGINIP